MRITSTIATYMIAVSPGNCAFDWENVTILSSVDNAFISSTKIRIAFQDFSLLIPVTQTISKNEKFPNGGIGPRN